MSAPRTLTTGLLRRLAALGLVAWLAGAGCLLGCSAVTASAYGLAPSQAHAARDESHSAAEPDSCAAMRKHDCCGSVGEKEGTASAGARGRDSHAAMHCPLGGRHASDPARKVRVQTTPTAFTPAAQSPAPDSNYVTPARAADILVRDRGSTHLRCCVFLI